MRVLGYLVPEFPSQTHAFFWREVQGLRALGATVCLVSTMRPPAGACRHKFATEAAAQTDYLFPRGILALRRLLTQPARLVSAVRYVLHLKETPWYRRFFLLGMLPLAARLADLSRARGFDHIHIHSCASAAHLGALAQILGGPTYSLTLHGDLPVYGTDHRAKMRNATFVACVTRQLRDRVVEEVGLAVEKVPVLWMGVDLSRYHAGKTPTEPGAIRAIMVARLTWPKGHSFALQALKRLKDSGLRVELQIVGDGPYRHTIVKEMNALDMAGETRFLGTLSEDDVARCLADSDVLLLPSIGIGEAAPVSVMEAMASGRPVIASIIGGTPDMINNGVNGYLCEQENVDCIADHLTRLASDMQLRERIGASARLKAEQDFDSSILAARLFHQIYPARS